MKSINIEISVARQRRELTFVAICFAIGVCLNIYSIIHFATPWYEIFSQIGHVTVISVILYILTILIRGVLFGVKHLILKK